MSLNFFEYIDAPLIARLKRAGLAPAVHQLAKTPALRSVVMALTLAPMPVMMAIKRAEMVALPTARSKTVGPAQVAPNRPLINATQSVAMAKRSVMSNATTETRTVETAVIVTATSKKVGPAQVAHLLAKTPA